MALELKQTEQNRNIKSFFTPIIMVIAGISLVAAAYIAAGYFQIASNERLELTKLIVTAILGTATIVSVIDRIK